MAESNEEIREENPEREVLGREPEDSPETAGADEGAPAETPPATPESDASEEGEEKPREKAEAVAEGQREEGGAEEKPRLKEEATGEAEAEEETARKKPRPKREKADKEQKPQVPLPSLALWRNGQFEPLGKAQIVKGPYELLVRPDEPKEGNARRPLTGKLEIEGQFNLPQNLLNDKTVIQIGDLLLHVYVLSTSNTGGRNGDNASFIIAQEMQDEDEVRALYPLTA